MTKKHDSQYLKIKKFLSQDKGFERGINRERTLCQYTEALRRHIGLDMLEGFNPEEIINHLKRINLKVSTKKLIYCATRKWFLLADRKDIVRVLEDNKPVFKSNRSKRYLTYSELIRLYNYCDTLEKKIVFHLLALSGLRPATLLYIRCEDVKETNILIQGYIVGNKAKQDYYANLTKRTKKLIDKYKKEKKKQPKDFLFDFNKEWDKLAEQTKIWKLNDYINTIGKEAGFSKMNPYFLRHTFGVMHYNAYNDILKTRDKMGQLNVSATEVYAVSDDVWKDKSRELLEVGL